MSKNQRNVKIKINQRTPKSMSKNQRNVKCTHCVLQNQCQKKEKTRTCDFIMITNICITDTIVQGLPWQSGG